MSQLEHRCWHDWDERRSCKKGEHTYQCSRCGTVKVEEVLTDNDPGSITTTWFNDQEEVLPGRPPCKPITQPIYP